MHMRIHHSAAGLSQHFGRKTPRAKVGSFILKGSGVECHKKASCVSVLACMTEQRFSKFNGKNIHILYTRNLELN
ncbi:hypothetical protein IMY05_009G0072000 [Salix suchowensis]|nr:hypothetical protein IMY05_009G0072000 [Salix suchowensis]